MKEVLLSLSLKKKNREENLLLSSSVQTRNSPNRHTLHPDIFMWMIRIDGNR